MSLHTLIEELREAASHLSADAALHRAQGLAVGTIDVERVEVLADLMRRAADAHDAGSSRTEERDRLAEQAGYAIGDRLRDALIAASSQAEAITLLCDALADAAGHPASLNGFAVSLLPFLFTDKEA